MTGGGSVNILASAELSKMFPTPPSHEQPMQSPCGQLEGSTDIGCGVGSVGDLLYNNIKNESSMNGLSPPYTSDDPNKVYLFQCFHNNSILMV